MKSSRIIKVCQGLILLIFPVTSLLAETQPASIAAPPVAYAFKMLGAMCLVFALLWVFTWLLRKSSLSGKGANGLLEIKSILPLGTKEKLVLVQVKDEQLLLAITPGSIKKIHCLKKETPTEKVKFQDKLKTQMASTENKQP